MKFNVTILFVLGLFCLATISRVQSQEIRMLTENEGFENRRSSENKAVVDWIVIDEAALEDLRREKPASFYWGQPMSETGRTTLAEDKNWQFPDALEWERVDFTHPDIAVSFMSKSGLEKSFRYQTRLIMYRLKNPGMMGFLAVHVDRMEGLIRTNGQTLELALSRNSSNDSKNQHVWIHVESMEEGMDFECGVNDGASLGHAVKQMGVPAVQRAQMDPVCAEIALDMDNYTYNTFDSCFDAVDWGLAVLAGANEVYMYELDEAVTLQPVHFNLWVNPEPWAGISENAQGSLAPQLILDALAALWDQDSYLSDIERDLVHMISKRVDTGTGGIAFVDGVCNGYIAVGFSSAMSQDYADFPSYSYNLQVVCHEMGHNFGSDHTHWCGWPGDAGLHPNGAEGGPFLICYNQEGDCPEEGVGQEGTIMSYCYSLDWYYGNLEFHPMVEVYALLPTILDAGCLNECNDFIEPCLFLGCTDVAACNYDESALVNDGSCVYASDFYDCYGNCLQDLDDDEICDDVDECVGLLDACGVCNGPGEIWECGCFGLTETLHPNEFEGFYEFGASDSATSTHQWQGELEALEVDLLYTGLAYSWPSDMRIQISDPSGNCVLWGGYNIAPNLSCTDLGAGDPNGWPDFWNTSSTGLFSHTMSLESVGLSGIGGWEVMIQNAWDGSPNVSYDLQLNFIGLSDVCSCSTYSSDALGICDGDCEADADADGICDNEDDCIGSLDDCGVCNGPGAIFECGCFNIPEGFCDCSATLLDSDGDGVCDEDEIAGCTNPSACNYNDLATDSDGSCEWFNGFTIYQSYPTEDYIVAGEVASFFVIPIDDVTFSCEAEDPLLNDIFGPIDGTEWEISFPNIAGSARVTVKGTHDVGGSCVVLDHRDISVTLPPPVGISEPLLELGDWMAFPSPARDILLVQFASDQYTAGMTGPWILRVFSTSGQTITTQSFMGNTALEMSNLADGMYYLSLSGPEGISTRRFVVAKSW